MEKKNNIDERKWSKEIKNMAVVKPGMQLAANLYDYDGKLLLKEGITLNDKSIEFLRRRGIEFIRVYKIEEEETIIKEERVPTIAETKHFQVFNDAYSEEKVKTEELIRDISNGGVIDPDQILDHTGEMMSQLDNKKDILSYLSFIKDSDDVTYGHSMNVAMLCNLFGEWLELPKEELRVLTVAGMLHDVGKTRIPQEIILKNAKLNHVEFNIIKTHPIHGYNILRDLGADIEIQNVALMHHERSDGSGYPNGIKGDKISKFASIVSICDIYDAMTSDRNYRNKICPFTIIDTFENKSYGELHTEYLLLFLKNIANSYQNHYVKLSNGQTGEVIFMNPRHLSRPIIQVGKDAFIDLEKEKSVSILEVY